MDTTSKEEKSSKQVDTVVSDCSDEDSSCEEEEEKTLLKLQGTAFFASCARFYNKQLYDDVTAMINSTVPTLIDGDALMMYAVLQDSHLITLGNQFLHVTYICERFLDMLMQKGANCILVFFDLWELIWDKNLPLRTLRRAIYHHFKSNTTVRTYRFLWYYAPTFCDFKKEEKPRAILSDLTFPWTIGRFNRKWENTNFYLNRDHDVKLFASSLVYCIAADLPIIDIKHTTIGVTLIHSFTIAAKPVLSKIYIKCEDDLLHVIPLYRTVSPERIELTPDSLKITRDLILEAANHFLKKYKNENELKFLLLYYASKLILPTENRASPKIELEKELLETFQDIINRWHDCLYIILYNVRVAKVDLDFQHIADLWQGTLFMYIVNLVHNPIENSTQLGLLQTEYERFIADFNKRFCVCLNPYPLEPILQGNDNFIQTKENSTDEMVKLNKVDNPLINKFCENIFDEVLWENPAKFFDTKQYFEERHWHCRKPILDGLQGELRRTTKIHSSKQADRLFQKQFRYYNVYGENLEGKITQYDAIIYQEPKEVKKPPKEQSKSSKLMQEKIRFEKTKIALESDMKELKKFKEGMNLAVDIIQLKDGLYHITNIIKRMSGPETTIKASILKLKILKAIVSNERPDNKINGIKEVFLTIRTILRMRDEESVPIEIDGKYKKYISKLLQLYGFGEIGQRNNLPIDETNKKEYEYNWVRFQMEHLSADLLQERSSPFDPDINFAPDKWQVEFIEAIRHNESALVVAPTSSGKTFACYYCMKRVLQNSLNGIVIYVAPTKALVNQVAATVTHRFKNVKLPEDGTNLVGIFTREHRRNPTTSRILITVPQCLDILLMSPCQYNWIKRIKYVVFDEVHRLSGNEEGLVWERLLLMIRCPFLALSATISDANLFYQWLQSMEHFKQEQDRINNCLRETYTVRCVVHEERHSNLTKYVYTSGSLQHYHPYCALHHRILLDRGKVPESITLSSKETMQLYDILSGCAREYMPTELDYMKFFDHRTESGFITKKSVREYETELGKIFYRVYEENNEIYQAILKKLMPPNYENLETGRVSLQDGYNLLHHMADNKMLPAIVFSYNRVVVEAFCKRLLPKIKSKDSEEMSRKERKAEKRIQKKKLASKEKGRKDKNNGDEDNSWSLAKANTSTPVDVRKNPINILAHTGSKFKGIGIVDREDLEFIETRLYGQFLSKVDDGFRQLLVSQLQCGLGYHHAGVDKKVRDTVEMLFRLGILRVVVATGTLAVGVHMPCKSVVIFGDSPYLNSLEYHQMSGRAGRRGFDNEGNVIFLNLTKKRHDMLMTDKLPKMLGNYPINVSLVARLLLLVAGMQDDKVPSDEYTKISVSRALTLLENSLIFQIKPHLKQQVKHFVGFSLQLLLMQQIINTKGVPTPWCSFITHLHYHEPANLALTYLFRCGAFTNLVKITQDDEDLRWKLVVVLCHLFTKIPLSERHKKVDFKNSVVVLDPLPKCIEQALSQYNTEVKFVFNQYFLSVARHLRPTLGADNTLPLSKVEFKGKKYDLSEDGADTLLHKLKHVCYQREITSAFVALSGNNDNSLSTHNLISNIRHEICPEINVVPEIRPSRDLNGYALDFYRHGSKVAINRDNRLRQGMDFAQLNDFRLALNSIVLALEDLELTEVANERLLASFSCVRNRYNSLFEAAYYYKK